MPRFSRLEPCKKEHKALFLCYRYTENKALSALEHNYATKWHKSAK